MSAALGRCAFILYLTHTVASNVPVVLKFNENHVYNGSRLSLLCQFGTHWALTYVTVDAFNGSLRVGSLHCGVNSNVTNGTGLFVGRNFTTGCPTFVPTSGNVSMSMEASPNLELEYNCSVKVNNGTLFNNGTSNSVRLHLRVLPSVPEILPENLSFNESDIIALKCHSSQGKPPANVKLTVKSTSGILLHSSEGNDSVSLNVSVTRTWHNAMALCNVTNHLVQTKNLSITVNHIAVNHSEPLEVNTDTGDVKLNCTAKIAVFPSATYKWSIPDGLDGNDSSLSSDVFNVKQGYSGAFNCTATNTVTSNTVLVVFSVTNTTQNVKRHILQSTANLLIWAVPINGFTILILAVILSVLYKRGYFQKSRIDKRSHMLGPSQPLNNSGDDQGGDVAMAENLIYEPFVSQPSDNAQNTKHCVSSFSSCEGTRDCDR